MRTEIQRVTGEERVAHAVAGLVHASMWFTCEPLPDDEWEITVRTEELYRLTGVLSDVERLMPKRNLVVDGTSTVGGPGDGEGFRVSMDSEHEPNIAAPYFVSTSTPRTR